MAPASCGEATTQRVLQAWPSPAPGPAQPAAAPQGLCSESSSRSLKAASSCWLPPSTYRSLLSCSLLSEAVSDPSLDIETPSSPCSFPHSISLCSTGAFKYKVCACVFVYTHVRTRARAQSCPTLCDPMDYSPPGSPVHGIFQTKLLEWVVISFDLGSSRPGDETRVSCVSCIGRQILDHCTTWETFQI